EVLLETQNINIQIDYIENIEEILESSTSKRPYESNESESSNK
ncbi:1131_t:CDS:1, partial [Scutellospora calospora]